MMSPCNLKPLVSDLLAQLNAPEDDFEDSLGASVHPLLSYACALRLYYYLAGWILAEHSSLLDAETIASLTRNILANRTRNILIFNQMRQLNKAFKKAGIPLLFIKGSSGFIRGVYSEECHYMTDIDAMIPMDYLHDVQHVLLSLGYTPDPSLYVSEYFHHLIPYYHPGHIAAIEIHKEPYFMKKHDISYRDSIWDDAEKVTFRGDEYLIPSVQDHSWIVMRSNGTGIEFMPRPKETLEIMSFLNAGYDIDFFALNDRAELDALPGLVPGIVYGLRKYGLKNIYFPYDVRHLERWEAWSRYARSKGTGIKASRKRFGSLAYLAGPIMKYRMELFMRTAHYELQSDCGRFSHLTLLRAALQPWRMLKNFIMFFICMAEYSFFGQAK